MGTKFRKKPVVIEAIQWTGDNFDQIEDFTSKEVLRILEGLAVRTLEGTRIASLGDWIIKGVEGEFYPCKPSIFEKTYERVEGSVAESELAFKLGLATGKLEKGNY